MACQIFDPAPPALMQQSLAARSGADPDPARVFGIGHALRQAASTNPVTMRLMVGGFTCSAAASCAQGHRPPENQHRQGREPGRAFARGGILLAHPAQYVNGCGMQPVSDGGQVPGRGRIFLLASGHEI